MDHLTGLLRNCARRRVIRDLCVRSAGARRGRTRCASPAPTKARPASPAYQVTGAPVLGNRSGRWAARHTPVDPDRSAARLELPELHAQLRGRAPSQLARQDRTVEDRPALIRRVRSSCLPFGR